MPAERFGPAGFYGGHHLKLGEADTPRIGLAISRAVFAKDISDLQRRTGQRPRPSFQLSISQLGKQLVGAVGVPDQFCRNMGIERRRAEFGMAQQNLNDPHVRASLQEMRCEAMT